MPHAVRSFQPDDAACVDDLWRGAFAGFESDFAGADEALSLGVARLAATGWRILVAEDADGACGAAVRWWDDEGIAWFDLLVSEVFLGGRDLVREVERRAQRAGLRLLRCFVPPDPALAAYFAFLGYREVGNGPDGARLVERRLPLLTVREQRRSDAPGIAQAAGLDPWPFEQGARSGWFVLADGEFIGGVASVSDHGMGEAAVELLELLDAYRGRDIERWMLVRAGEWAARNGFHTVSVDERLVAGLAERDLEDIGWFAQGARFVRRDVDITDEPI